PLAPERYLVPAARVVVALFFNDPEDPLVVAPERLQKLYGLTPAESELASLLVEGHSLVQAAQLRSVRYGTANNRLDSIFRKIGCSSQSGVIRMIVTGPALLGQL